MMSISVHKQVLMSFSSAKRSREHYFGLTHWDFPSFNSSQCFKQPNCECTYVYTCSFYTSHSIIRFLFPVIGVSSNRLFLLTTAILRVYHGSCTPQELKTYLMKRYGNILMVLTTYCYFMLQIC